MKVRTRRIWDHKPIYGQDIGPGDKIIGIESSGIHSNGFTELRKNKIAIPDYFSESTYIYSKLIVHLVEEHLVTGLVNVTGGGMNNIHRLRTPYKPIIPLPGMLDKKNKHMNDISNVLLWQNNIHGTDIKKIYFDIIYTYVRWHMCLLRIYQCIFFIEMEHWLTSW